MGAFTPHIAATFVPRIRQHFTGFILSRIRDAVRKANAEHPGDEITIDSTQQNGSYGIYQARVRLAGDPTVYRLILAPADAPIMVDHGGPTPIRNHFIEPLGSEAA
jgi:hypothetical protein